MTMKSVRSRLYTNRIYVFTLHVQHALLSFFNDTATTEIYTLSLHDALPITIIIGFMTAHKEDPKACGECGARLAPDLRYCVHCYAPVGTGSTRAHVELAGEITTTRRADPTRVFSPERHKAIARRKRSHKRLAAMASIGIVLIIAGSISLRVLNRRQREAARIVARENSARREIDLMADALERFRADVLRYPTNEE